MLVDFRESGRKREGEREEEREREHGVVAFLMCPAWGLNPQPFRIWGDAPTS